jgi:hypothetical protein
MNPETFELNPCNEEDKVRSVTATFGKILGSEVGLLKEFWKSELYRNFTRKNLEKHACISSTYCVNIIPGEIASQFSIKPTSTTGNLDAAAILIMVIFGILFEKVWVNKVVEDNDAGNITPADFGTPKPSILPR